MNRKNWKKFEWIEFFVEYCVVKGLWDEDTAKEIAEENYEKYKDQDETETAKTLKFLYSGGKL